MYADLDFLTAYCADTLPTHFAPDALAALLRTFITDLPKGRWSSAAEAEIVERVVAPLMATARDRGTLDAVLPTPLLDTILETLAGPPDADIATRMMQQARPLPPPLPLLAFCRAPRSIAHDHHHALLKFAAVCVRAPSAS